MFWLYEDCPLYLIFYSYMSCLILKANDWTLKVVLFLTGLMDDSEWLIVTHSASAPVSYGANS